MCLANLTNFHESTLKFYTIQEDSSEDRSQLAIFEATAFQLF